MPNQQAPVQLPSVDLDNGEFEVKRKQLEAAYALSLVTQTFNTFETFRTKNHDIRWSVSDSLYTGFVPTRMWEGSNVPRANVSHKLVFDHVEAALPAITQAVFGLGDQWFSVTPDGEATPQDARKVKKALSYVVQHARDDYGATAAMQAVLAFKDILLYGNGGVAVEWDFLKNRPKIERVDLRDIYVDPGLSDPSLDRSRSVIRRRMMTVAELIELRDDPRMNIPTDEELAYLAKTSNWTYGDQTKAVQEAYRGVNYQPSSDPVLPNPSNNFVEVLIYYSLTRIIWVIGRQVVAYNGKNPYGFFPFCFAPCFVFPNRWYALSFADVLEDKQRGIEGLFNAHLDEVALALNPPRSQAAQSNVQPSRRAWAPGMVFNSGNQDPSKNIQLLQPTPVTTNVMGDISFLEIGAEKTTGINAVGQGIPRPGNANRTATGMTTQLQGSASRLSTLVSNIEDYLLTPLLYKIYLLLKFHVNSFDRFATQDADGNVEWIEGGVFQQRVQFRMQAASKMVTREKLMQIFPFLTQYLMSGPLLQGLAKSGLTVNYQELFQFLQDASGVEQLYSFVRPMTPEEQQAAQQPDPATAQKAAQAQMESQTEMGKAQLQSQTALQVAQIAKQPAQGEAEMEQIRLQLEREAKQQEMELKRQEGALKIELEQMKLALARQKAELDMITKQAESQQKMQLKQAEGQVALQTKQQEAAINLENQQLQSMFDRAAAAQNHQQSLQQGQEAHKTKLTQMKDLEGQKATRATDKKGQPARSKSPRKRV